jgi:hypothetical protein
VPADQPTSETAVSMFKDRDANLPEARLDVSHLARPSTAPARYDPNIQTVDMTGKAKALMAIGLGATGKTTLLRWACERALERSEDDQLVLATVDPVNRELGYYFPETMSPQTQEPTQITAWLEQMLASVMEAKKSIAIDFGGGDTTLSRLLTEVPDLQQMMQDAGVEPVALYPLTPRSSDLTPIAAMAQAGFRPKAAALILNEGRADSTRAPLQEFGQIRRHSVYKSAIAQGAVEIWMPRLYAAKAIEDRRLGFRQAVNGEMPVGGLGLGPFDRSRTRHWLAAMEEAFAPIASWLP